MAGYACDEGAGGTIADVSGNGLTGTLVSGASWSGAGRYGAGLSLNGSSAYVDLGNPALLQLTGSMTVSAWVNAAGTPADDGQIVAKSTDASGWQLKSSPDTGPHTFGIAVSGGPGPQVQRYSATVRTLNTWYHVAGVYNATARTLDIYVNGVLDNGVLIGTVPASQVNSPVNVNVGRRTGGYHFNGLIDEVRITDRALTPAEIQAAMNTPLGAGGAVVVVESREEERVAAETPSPTQYSLSQRFANPARASTPLAFSLNLPVAGHVKLEVFNVQGSRVAVIVDEDRASGSYVEHFNARGLPSGFYFVRVAAGRFTTVRKIVLTK